MKRHANNQQGFTLIEMIVAVFIFVIVVVAMFDLFLLTQRAQRTAASLQHLQDDMRFALNRMTDEVRDGGIDYQYYADNGITIDPIAGNSELAIRTFDGNTMRFKVGDGSLGECVNPNVSPELKRCLLIKENDSASWRSMTSDGISVDDIHFYITPNKDPFVYDTAAGAYQSNQQPRVRILISGSGKVRQQDRRVSMFLQTLIATREYRR